MYKVLALKSVARQCMCSVAKHERSWPNKGVFCIKDISNGLSKDNKEMA